MFVSSFFFIVHETIEKNERLNVFLLTGTGGKQTAFVVKPKQAEIIEALPLPIKTLVSKNVPVKLKETTTSPKIQSGNKEQQQQQQHFVQKQDKIQKKKKGSFQKSVGNVPGGKDIKMGQVRIIFIMFSQYVIL